MIQRIRVFLFYFFLTVLLFTSGWGIPNGKIISIHIVQIFPCILFGMSLLQGRKIHIPKLLTLVFVLFSLIISATTLIAVNVEVAFEYQLYYVSIFLLFIYVNNEKVILKKYFLTFIKYSSVATVFYSIFIQLLLPEQFNILIPTNSSQFVYKFAGYLNHHPLGAYLVIPLAVLFITMVSTRRINDAFSLLLLFLLLIFSNLRAGYVGFISVIITTLFYERKKILSKKIVIVVVGIFLITVISLGINSRNGLNIPLLTPINESLVQNGFRAVYRSFFNTRDEYIKESFIAIADKPILGFGASNFYYASMLHTPTIEGLATTAHNLFLNIAVENGLLGLIIFSYCILLLLSKIPNVYKKGSVEDKSIAAIFIGLLVLFQFNFHYRIYFLFVMLFICGAFIYEENGRITDKKHIAILVSGIIAFISGVILIAKILFLNGNSALALQFYPIYTEAYKSEIKKSYDRKDIRQLKIYLIRYNNLFSKDPQQLQVIGDAFLNLHDNSNALDKYKEALQLFPKETGLIINVYTVYQKINQENEGQIYIKNHIKKYEVLKNRRIQDNQFMIAWFKQYGVEL